MKNRSCGIVRFLKRSVLSHGIVRKKRTIRTISYYRSIRDSLRSQIRMSLAFGGGCWSDPAAELDDFSSFSEACILAAEAEISNVALYATMFDAFAEYPDLLYVATALQTASQNQHLPAFERCSDN